MRMWSKKGSMWLFTIIRPDSQKIIEVDSPTGTQGTESVKLITRISGIYQVKIFSLDKESPAGQYEIQIKNLRVATERDNQYIAAEQAYKEAEQLNIQRTAESLQKAITKFEESLSLWQILGDTVYQAHTLDYIGKTYFDLGDKKTALGYYEKALPLLQQVGDQKSQAITLNDMGAAYWALGEYQTALKHYDRSLTIKQALGDSSAIAYAFNNIGAVYRSLGENQKALDYYNQALSLSQKIGDRSGQAHLLTDIGKVYVSLDNNKKALDLYNKALSMIKTVGNPYIENIVPENMGWLHFQLKEHQKAIDCFNQAFSLAKITGNRDAEAKALRGIAWVEREQNDLAQARAHIERAIDIIDSLRTKVLSKELRASYFAEYHHYYEFYIDLLMQFHNRQLNKGYDVAALQVSEQARARSLLEILNEVSSDIHHGIDAHLLVRERNVLQQLNGKEQYLKKLKKSNKDVEQIALAEKEIRTLLTELDEIRTQIRINSPRYAALIQPQPLNTKDIHEQVLDAETILLNYALGKNRSFLWAVTPDTVFSYELPVRKEIDARAKTVYELLTARNQRISNETRKEKAKRIAKEDSNLYQALSKLSTMVIGPVAKHLHAKRLLIVCEGALQYIPFGSLPIGVDQAESKTDITSPLILEHEIVCLPSASVLSRIRKEADDQKQSQGLIAVLADPVFSIDDPRVERSMLLAETDITPPLPTEDEHNLEEQFFTRSIQESGFGSNRSEISRLPFSRQEAIGISSLTHSEKSMCALDFDANYATATSPELNNYHIIHFATHGLLNSTHPELSGLVLSLIDEQGNPQHGFLRLHDIYNLNLNADLVVLSACQTALGKDV